MKPTIDSPINTDINEALEIGYASDKTMDAVATKLPSQQN
jgi:hypothetical protein